MRKWITFRNELLRVDLERLGHGRDLVVHDWLREQWLVALVVAEPTE
jgi:hypothetical protein